MQLRRALSAGALVLALGSLTSCGFELMTDQPFAPGEGTNTRVGEVDVLSALVVAAQPNEGTFVVTLVNNSPDEVALNGVSGTDLEVDEFEPVEIAPREMVNFADEGGIPMSGDFDAGQLLALTLTFSNGDSTEMNVPIVPACGPYEGLDLTEDSEFIPYDCEYEAPPPGEKTEIDPAGGGGEDTPDLG